MKLEFLFAPTSDLGAWYALYRDHFGAEEVWREGETTIALRLPGSDVQLMLDSNDANAPVGPLFIVESVAEFHQTHERRSWRWWRSRPRSPAVPRPPTETRTA